jgi:hypothetical protein
METNINHDEFVKTLFSDGFLITYPWTLNSTIASFMGNGKSPGVSYSVRKVISKELYSSPHDSWRQVWNSISGRMAKSGEYCRPEKAVEAWMQLKRGGGTLEESVKIDDWPNLAKRILEGKPTMGLLAVRGHAADDSWSPGVTVVVETPRGGSFGASLVMDFLGNSGVGGCLPRQEKQDRWGVVKLICSPSWYVACGDKCFGVDWKRWAHGPVDEIETKRLWCEDAALLIHRLKSEFRHIIDSVIFDEYALSDAVGDFSKQALTHICHSSSENLASVLKCAASKDA